MRKGGHMIQITYEIEGSVDRNSINSINRITGGALSNEDMSAGRINRNTMNQNTACNSAQQNNNYGSSSPSYCNVQSNTQQISKMKIPQLRNMIQKGQKVPISFLNSQSVDVCMGWNVNNADCDVDVSAFLLNDKGKVIGDSWFVFYGQTDSPDGNVHFSAESRQDREEVSVNLSRLNPLVKKIVFVLTINDAFPQKLNFSMINDAYIRILDHSSRQEIVSFKMDEYYSNVISMMIGELYIYNGAWKFNAIGNGVAKDLAGLCQLYGVQVV